MDNCLYSWEVQNILKMEDHMCLEGQTLAISENFLAKLSVLQAFPPPPPPPLLFMQVGNCIR